MIKFKIQDGPPIAYFLHGIWHWTQCHDVSVNYLNSKKFIYIHIPKTGGSSITQQYQDIFYLGHVYTTIYPVKFRSKIFTVVRNPYSRLVSAYLFMERGGFRNNEEYSNLIEKYPTFTDWVLNGLDEITTYYDSQNIVTELTVPQYRFICDNDKLIIPQGNILYFENLNEDCTRLLDEPIEIKIIVRNIKPIGNHITKTLK